VVVHFYCEYVYRTEAIGILRVTIHSYVCTRELEVVNVTKEMLLFTLIVQV